MRLPDNAEGRPGGGDLRENAHAGGGSAAILAAPADIPRLTGCPLIRAALSIGDYRVMLAVLVYHPASLCPARREAA